MGVALAAIMLISSLVACGAEHNYNLECDRGDQIEHDSDCGYVDTNNQWIWFSWVKLGEDSHSPNGWEPPNGVQVQEDEEGSQIKKPKKSKTKATSRR